MNFASSDRGRKAYLLTHRKRARVEIVPLIDVMFLLVAFFMVVSVSMVQQRGIHVNLSEAETGEVEVKDNNSLFISLDSDGNLYFNKKELSIDNLSEFLKRRSVSDPSTSVVINADRATNHGEVVRVLDLVRKSGLGNVIFSVEPVN